MSSSSGAPSLAEPAILLLAAVAGFLVSNSGWGDAYHHFIHTPIQVAVGGASLLDKSLLHIINDGLMAIFFLFVGLELKREIVVGELSDMRKAMLPILAAIGGMLMPAFIYFLLNPSGPAAHGWGVPMATDIAFAMGILAVLGSRVPASLKILLTAVAIVDDLGAILVIAIFYTSSLNLVALGAALLLWLVALGLNRAHVMRTSLYVALGIPIWYLMLKSGIHATISGVLLASVIPLAGKGESTARLLSDIFARKASAADSPAVFLEKSLAQWVGVVIIPLFAFCNSGVALDHLTLGNVGLGVMLGLILGKPLGIVGGSVFGQKIGLVELPSGVRLSQLIGLGCLGGIGFTMSLFISSLAFTEPSFHDEAKLAILMGSMISAFLGVGFLLRPAPR